MNRWLVALAGVLLTVFAVSLAAADCIGLPWGRICYLNNGQTIQSINVEDPAELRGGATHGHIKFKVSGNHIGPDGREVEIGMLVFKLDERNRCNPANLSGQVELWVLDHSRGEGDNAMQRVAMWRTGQAWDLRDPEPPGNVPCAGGYRR